jgi:hypothetical protein
MRTPSLDGNGWSHAEGAEAAEELRAGATVASMTRHAIRSGANRGGCVRWIVAAVLVVASPAAGQDTTKIRIAPGQNLPAMDTAGVVPDSMATLHLPPQADTAGEIILTEPAPGSGMHASPLLPFDHWAVQAARRAEAMGLTRFFPAQRAVPRAEVARALLQSAGNASTPRLQRLTQGWLDRFREEFPEYGPGSTSRSSGAVTLLGSPLTVGFERWTGRLAPAIGYQTLRQDPQPLPDVSDPRATLWTGIATQWASLSGEGAYRGGEAVLRQWDAALGFGAFQLSVGRAPVGYGWGRMGGIVYASPDPLPRIEFQSTRPFRLPWVLHALGPVTLHTFAGPVSDPARHPTDPNLWGLRAAFQPHPRLTLGASRGAMFGGEGDPTTVTSILKMLAGVVHSTFENQVISLDARYRLPTDGVLPATAYVEWGADDAAGAMDETPGRVIGLFLPALPGVPEAGLGAEYTYFKHGCCGHGPWYLNSTFPGNWAAHGRPLGHPLGGEGSEYAAYLQASAWDARLRLDARGWIRDRSDRSLLSAHNPGGGNLFTPERTGRSTGGTVEAALRLLPRADLRASGWMDDGSGWREQAFSAALAWTF